MCIFLNYHNIEKKRKTERGGMLFLLIHYHNVMNKRAYQHRNPSLLSSESLHLGVFDPPQLLIDLGLKMDLSQSGIVWWMMNQQLEAEFGNIKSQCPRSGISNYWTNQSASY